jgi:hypothetical protein
LNLANKITIARILLVPVFVVVFEVDVHAAAAVFLLASATDKLDGYIARKYNQITNLGKLLDPLADKLLIAAALILMVNEHLIGAWDRRDHNRSRIRHYRNQGRCIISRHRAASRSIRQDQDGVPGHCDYCGAAGQLPLQLPHESARGSSDNGNCTRPDDLFRLSLYSQQLSQTSSRCVERVEYA